MAVAEIHHVQVAIPAGGEDRARRFYGGLLGFVALPKPANLARRGGVWFRTGNLDLHLGVDPAFHPATKAHVAYRVSDLPDLRHRLAAAGHPSTTDEPLPGYDRCYVDDPFGNRVELLEDELGAMSSDYRPRGRSEPAGFGVPCDSVPHPTQTRE